MNDDNWMICGLGLLFVAFIAAIIMLSIKEENEWIAYRNSHECKVVGKMDSSVAPTIAISGSGKVVSGATYVSGKTGWLCNDGITYWKDE